MILYPTKANRWVLIHLLFQTLVSAGWTADSFAHVVSTPEGFESVWDELLPTRSLDLLQKSGIRALWAKLREVPVTSSAASGSKTTEAVTSEKLLVRSFPS